MWLGMVMVMVMVMVNGISNVDMSERVSIHKAGGSVGEVLLILGTFLSLISSISISISFITIMTTASASASASFLLTKSGNLSFSSSSFYFLRHF